MSDWKKNGGHNQKLTIKTFQRISCSTWGMIIERFFFIISIAMFGSENICAWGFWAWPFGTWRSPFSYTKWFDFSHQMILDRYCRRTKLLYITLLILQQYCQPYTLTFSCQCYLNGNLFLCKHVSIKPDICLGAFHPLNI